MEKKFKNYFIINELEYLGAKEIFGRFYSLRKKYIFYEFLLRLMERKGQIRLRVDSNDLSSKIIDLGERIKGPSEKQWWIYFEVDNNTPKNEIIRLIKEVYEFSE